MDPAARTANTSSENTSATTQKSEGSDLSKDPMSSYILNNGDGPGSVVVTPALDGNNYHSWSRSLMIALRSKNKIGFVDGSIARPSDGDALFSLWNRCNLMVISWILNSVSKDIAANILFLSTAQEMWNVLKDRYSQSNGPRIFEIQQSLFMQEQGDLTVTEYFTKIDTLWNVLHQFLPPVTCTCGAMKGCSCQVAKKFAEREDQFITMKFLMGLSDTYSNTRGRILLMNPMPSLNQIFDMVCSEERQRTAVSTTQSQNEAMAMQFNSNYNTGNQNAKMSFYQHKGNNSGYTQNHKKKGKIHCTHCNWDNHTKDNCYKLIGYPPGHRLHKGNQGNGSQFNRSAHQVSKENVDKPGILGKPTLQENNSFNELELLLTPLKPKKMSAEGSSSRVWSQWSHLPSDMLTMLINRLDNGCSGALSINSLRLRSVCKSWRSSILAQDKKNAPLKLPFPIVPHPELSSKSPQGNFTLSKSPIYLIQQHHSVDSYWVLRVEEERYVDSSGNGSGKKLQALNPLARTITRIGEQKPLVLPKGFPKSINLLNFRIFEIGGAYNLDCVDQNFLKVENNNDEDGYVRIDKVVVSTSPLTDENNAPAFSFEKDYFAIMAICELKLWCLMVGGKKWIPIDDPKDSIFVDIVFHKGKFYALDYKGRVVSVGSDLKAREIAPKLKFSRVAGEYKNLVTAGGDLFMIDTFFESDPFAAYEGFDDDFLDEYFAQSDLYGSYICLKIYKLIEEKNVWERVSHLNNHVFFVGDDCSYSVIASDFAGLKPNCVYYYVDDSYRDYNEVCKLGEFFIGIGVFDMDAGTCGPLSNFPDHWPVFLPPSTWFKPNKGRKPKK